MQLVALSADGRVTAVASTVPAPGPRRVALEPDDDGVGVVALGPGVPRPVGRLGAADAAGYGPLLRQLRAQGLVGSCPARVTTGGALVLDLASPTDCMLANSPGDLVLLAPERTVTVTREQHHQDVLATRGGRMAVGLRPRTIAAGKYAGERGIEVTLDGRRVGELTRLMAQRYLPMVDEVAARGRRAGCEAVLRRDHRGVQVELRLPAVDAKVAPSTRPAPHPVLSGRRSAGASAGSSAWAPTAVIADAHRSGAAAPDWGATPTVTVPRQRPAPTTVAIVPPISPPPISPPAPGPAGGRPGRGRRRPVMWAGAAAVGVLLLAAVIDNGAKTAAPTTTSAADATRPAAVGSAASPAPTSTPTSTATSTVLTSTATRATSTSTTARAAAGAGAGAAVVAPAERTTARAAARTATPPPPPPSTRTTTSKPVAAAKPAGSGCDPNYSGCVPVASDVDCEGGSGNGPAYVQGPVRVTGKDVYGLDADHDGIACE
jgi:hypothetical protein